MNLVAILLLLVTVVIGSSTSGESVYLYKVPGITDDGTAASAQKAVGGLEGLRALVVSIPDSTVSVSLDETALGPRGVAMALESAGFTVECVRKVRLSRAGAKVPGPVP